MKTEVLSPINIILAGMDERSTSRMDTIFKIVFKRRCKFAQDENADLGIVDLDGEDNAWAKYQQAHPGLPAIVMSRTPVEYEGTIYVAKPAKMDLLWKAIFNLVKGLPSAAEVVSKIDLAQAPIAGNSSVAPTKREPVRSDINKAAEALGAQLDINLGLLQQIGTREGSGLYYKPDDYLLGQILSDLKKNTGQQCTLYVQCWVNRRLILLPDQDLAYTALTDSQLKNLGIVRQSTKFVTEISSVCYTDKKALPASEVDGLRCMSIKYLIWDLTLRTACGRVPEGTDLSIPFYLQAWPNFTRLPHIRHGMRIAALWAGSSSTLNDIARSLGINPAHVYTFYSAAEATGLITSATHRINPLLAPKKVIANNKKRDSLSSILSVILRSISKK